MRDIFTVNEVIGQTQLVCAAWEVNSAYFTRPRKKYSIRVKFTSGDGIDIEKERPDSQNWIPFEFVLTVEVEKYRFVEGGIPCYLYVLLVIAPQEFTTPS